MAGKSGMRCYPRHLRKNKGKGIRECEATGFLRPVGHPFVRDVRQGQTAREFADVTPGFGTHHPKDVEQLGRLADPSPIRGAIPDDKKNLTKSDLMISDQEIEASIREGRRPRKGF